MTTNDSGGHHGRALCGRADHRAGRHAAPHGALRQLPSLIRVFSNPRIHDLHFCNLLLACLRDVLPPNLRQRVGHVTAGVNMSAGGGVGGVGRPAAQQKRI